VAHKKTEFFFYVVKLKYWWGIFWMRWGVSILYLGLHASCSILRIFFSLHSWKRVEGGVFMEEILFSSKISRKPIFFTKNNGRYDQIHFWDLDVGGHKYFMLYPEPDINPIKSCKIFDFLRLLFFNVVRFFFEISQIAP